MYKSYRGQTTHFVWDGNVPLHEWVEGALEPTAIPATPPAWLAEAAISAREAALAEHLTRGPPHRGSASDPITWLFEPGRFAPARSSLRGSRSVDPDRPPRHAERHARRARRRSRGARRSASFGDLRNVEGDRFACPFRWPGQYEDAETGLYYNRFRYYDPDSGQYTSQDPIRLRGGAHLYAYVPDPLTWIDPLGLAKCESDDVVMVDPATLRWSQTTAGGRGRADPYRAAMAEQGWIGDPADLVSTPDGLVTVDHTRAAIALEQGIPAIPARIHAPDEALPEDLLTRRWNHMGDTATTWGEAAERRGAGQSPAIGPTGSPKPPRLPKPK